MDDAMRELAGYLAGLGKPADGLLMGKVTQASPLRVAVSGTAQGPDSLLKNAALDLSELRAGDALALWSVEEGQR